MLSNSSKYALKAVLYLALNSDESRKILAKNISEPINVPRAYIAKLLQELSRHNLVSSTRGPKGGFFLNVENRAATLIKIVDVIDGDHRLRSCMLSLKECNEDHPCPLHGLVGNAKSNFIKNLEKTTINDLAIDLEQQKSFLPV
ncbi:Rrf2 family transcriptional regulator [Maribacter sp.]|uniref:RrF2 family transcriptional regulator n=1 Tax=Maribacter sp. TaxID=1897614 RepID=UPI0025BAE5B8|nr:Rrf2 family transcriptional regulator [Maribacter sp.]